MSRANGGGGAHREPWLCAERCSAGAALVYSLLELLRIVERSRRWVAANTPSIRQCRYRRAARNLGRPLVDRTQLIPACCCKGS